ncbi:MAG: hypothetical protein INR62_11425 [Rhodospirillales bacterium]|nr:hypothetical protein [Acetobacter sp.]
MGYTHYFQQKRAFTDDEWILILGEAKRIVAKAAHGLYTGPKETAARRTFSHPEVPTPRQGEPILVAGPNGRGKPRLTKHLISLNGKAPLDYESFVLSKEPPTPFCDRQNASALTGFVKTEMRPYDAVVVSILAVAQQVAPSAITVTSDGGPSAVRYLF